MPAKGGGEGSVLALVKRKARLRRAAQLGMVHNLDGYGLGSDIKPSSAANEIPDNWLGGA